MPASSSKTPQTADVPGHSAINAFSDSDDDSDAESAPEVHVASAMPAIYKKRKRSVQQLAGSSPIPATSASLVEALKNHPDLADELEEFVSFREARILTNDRSRMVIKKSTVHAESLPAVAASVTRAQDNRQR